MRDVLKLLGKLLFSLTHHVMGGLLVTVFWNMLIVRLHFPPIPAFVGVIIYAFVMSDVIYSCDEDYPDWWNQYALKVVGVLGGLFVFDLIIKLLLY